VSRQLIEQSRVSLVGKCVLTRTCFVTRVKVGVGKLQFSGACFLDELRIVLHRAVYAGNVKVFRLLRRNLKVERLEWSDLGDEPEKEGE
jgi:hypothetical protein